MYSSLQEIGVTLPQLTWLEMIFIKGKSPHKRQKKIHPS